jgi:hypothetical protein
VILAFRIGATTSRLIKSCYVFIIGEQDTRIRRVFRPTDRKYAACQDNLKVREKIQLDIHNTVFPKHQKIWDALILGGYSVYSRYLTSISGHLPGPVSSEGFPHATGAAVLADSTFVIQTVTE